MNLGLAVSMDFHGGPYPLVKRLDSAMGGMIQPITSVQDGIHNLRWTCASLRQAIFRRVPRRRKNPITLEDP